LSANQFLNNLINHLRVKNSLGAPKETDFIGIHEKIEIVSTEDEKIKLIGGLLNNDSSRTILKLLFENEMTANEIAQKTGMLLSLVIHHLQKLQETGIVKINRMGKNSKGHDMKYYRATKLAIIILPPSISEKAKKSKSLFNVLKRIYKFAAIGIAGIVSWLALYINANLVRPGLASGNPESVPVEIIVPLLIVIIGLIVERAVVKFRK
jgi:DNA-binding transcriptional ArsR family regulator